MAHEIKNGMVAIKTFVDLLAQKGQDAELTEVVRRELQRINAIVTQMLRFAAPNRAAFTTVRVHELLDHSLRLLQHQISGKLISLQRHYQAEPDTVRGDDAQLQQAFMNLLLNALEAMGTNGVLTVDTEIGEGRTRRAAIADQHSRHRRGHRAGKSGPAVRAVFHDQEKRHGPGAGHQPAHRAGTSRRDSRAKRTRQRLDVQPVAAGVYGGVS